jgi:cell division septation protein DedD
MKDSDMSDEPLHSLQKSHQRLGGLLIVALLLILLLVASVFWNHGGHQHAGLRSTADVTKQPTVFLRLPQVISATTSPTESVAMASSIKITAPVASSASKPKTPASALAPVKPAPVAVTSMIANSCRTAGWYVQLGAFGKVSMAQTLVKKNQERGVTSCIGTLPANRLFRVMVGPQDSKNAAGLAAASIGQKAGQKGAYSQYWAPAQNPQVLPTSKKS